MEPELALLHDQELARGNRNRATLAVARKLVAYLLAVDRREKPFQKGGRKQAPDRPPESLLIRMRDTSSASCQALPKRGLAS